VCVRWLRDSYDFNEWANEQDYEPDDDAPVAQGRFSAEEDVTLWQAYKQVGRQFNEIRKWPGLAARPLNSVRQRLRFLLKKEEAGEDPLAAAAEAASRKRKSTGGGGGGDAVVAGGGRAGAGAKKAGERKKGVFRRVLAVNHACWDDEDDLQAALAAEPEVSGWG